MLDQLARMGWLRRRGVEYELGGKLVEMGILTLYQNKFDYVVAPLLYELQRVTGHAVHLGVLDGNDVLYLQKIETQSGPVRRRQRATGNGQRATGNGTRYSGFTRGCRRA